MPLVDLTQPFADGMYSLPGCPRVTLRRFATIEKDGLNDTVAEFAVHSGTHIDAPLHVFDGRRGIEAITLEELVGWGVGWSVERQAGEPITVADLERNTPKLERGDFVFLHTGWGRLFHQDHDRYRLHPYLSDEAARWLVDQGARMVAVDTPTPDLPFPLRPPGFAWPVHHILVGNEVLIVENAANLDRVAGRRFRVWALPIPMVGADGAPARIIAEL